MILLMLTLTASVVAGNRSGNDFDGAAARPPAGQLPEMAIMAAVFADDMHGPRGASALASGVRHFLDPLRANMVRAQEPLCARPRCVLIHTSVVDSTGPPAQYQPLRGQSFLQLLPQCLSKLTTPAQSVVRAPGITSWPVSAMSPDAVLDVNSHLGDVRQVLISLRKQRRLLEKEAVSFARQADRLDGEAGFAKLRRCCRLLLAALLPTVESAAAGNLQGSTAPECALLCCTTWLICSRDETAMRAGTRYLRLAMVKHVHAVLSRLSMAALAAAVETVAARLAVLPALRT